MTQKRTALVIGGAGGIGEAICKRLANDGFLVDVADRDFAAACRVQAELPGDGHIAEEIDVTVEANVNDTLDRVEARAPYAVMVLVVGGPLSPPGANKLTEMSLQHWNATVLLNMTGTFLCMRKYAKQRLARPLAHSRIVTFSSITSQRGGGALGAAYPATKSAVSGLTRHVAMELAESGITVNAIAPGSVDTAGFRRYVDDALMDKVASMIPVKRIGTPDEVAAAVSFLVAEDASFVTGTTLDVNGGAALR